MIPLFVGLSLVNLLCLGVTMALGYWTPPASRGLHILAGALATLVCCGVHCVVFTYFIATAKWLQHAIAVKGLNPALATPTRSFRKQAFPAALLAMASMFGAAVLGAAADNYAIRPAWHQIAGRRIAGRLILKVDRRRQYGRALGRDPDDFRAVP